MQFSKRATTIDEQLKKLTDRGIEILNKQKAEESLLDIGYFRLGFYCFPFEESYPEKKNRTHTYNRGSNFEDIVKLYYFDVDLRNLFSRYIYRIEINFRTYLIYKISNQFIDFPTWFANPSIIKKDFIDKFDEKTYPDIRKNTIIKAHHKKHINDRYAPAWKTLEFMTFGNIIKLYENIKDCKIQVEIAKYYGYSSIITFLNHLDIVRQLRNECAHNGVLFDLRFPKSISDGGTVKLFENKNNLAGAYSVMKHLLAKVSVNRVSDLETTLSDILSGCPNSIKSIISRSSGLVAKS